VTRPLYDLPRAKPMNERLWTREVPDPPITPVGDVQNAATSRDVSSAIAGQPLTGMLVREDLKVPKKETTMPRIVSTEADKESRRAALREYLVEHGATARKDLLVALGYPEGEKGYYQLRTDCEAIGATSESRQGPVSLAGQSPVARPALAPAEKPAKRPKAEAAEPKPAVIRPSLFVAVRDAIRAANATGAHLELEPAFVNALHLRLVEAGL